jgi:integrase
MEPASWQLRFVKFQDGERLPVLLSDAGVPHFDATLFATTQVRGTSAKPNTIYAVLAAVRLLLDWLNERTIDLAARVRDGTLLSSSELDSLSAYVATRRADMDAPAHSKVVDLASRRRNENARAGPSGSPRGVRAETKYARLTYIARFIGWLARRELEVAGRGAASLEQIKGLTTAIRAKRPRKSARTRLDGGRGLSEVSQRELFELLRIDSSDNPFEPLVRVRNALIVTLAYDLGVRAGELLSLKVADFDLVKNEVVIARRHDDVEDPRPQQPVVKTSDRRLPLSIGLADAVLRYVTTERYSLPQARRHPFLLVVHQPGPHQGRPISSKGLSKIFETLKHASPALSKLCCHALRHTNNERFSELMDQEGVPAAREEKLRSFSMGWKEGSGTAATYTRRHTERKAKEASLRLQGFKRPEREHE